MSVFDLRRLMKRQPSKITLLISITTFLISACGGDTPPTATILPPSPTAGITLTPEPTTATISVKSLASATGIDQFSCATGETRRFPEDTPIIYVVAVADVTIGTNVFVRLFHNGEEVEETEPIIADQSYDDICVFFTFEYDPAQGFFRRGEYSAQLFADGQLQETVAFVVE